MRPRTTLLGVTFASSLHSFGMQTSEFRSRGAGAEKKGDATSPGGTMKK